MVNSEATMSQSQRQKALPGENKIKVWSFLQRERVGRELLFTVECAERAAAEVGIRRCHVYGTLTCFEKEGLIKRTRQKVGEGTLVTFLPPKNKESQSQKEAPTVKLSTTSTSDSKKFSPATTFGEAFKDLDNEVFNIQAKIDDLRIKMEALEKTLSEKKSLRSHLLVLIGKEND